MDLAGTTGSGPASAIYPDLEGRIAVVTGGSKGIGAATCAALATNGVRVAVVAREPASIADTVRPLAETGAEVIGVAADVTRADDLARLREEVEDRLGPVDILAPFAGGFLGSTPVWETSLEEWTATIDANLTSTFLTCGAFIPGMMQRRQGAIVTMASCVARVIDANLTASYAAAKAGVIAFTRHIARELGPSGIRVNCVSPATTLSERVVRNSTPEWLERVAALAPLGRVGAAEDTAAATLFLASDAASWLTGITLDIAGGRVMV